VFLPAVVVPGLIFGVVFAWPWIDARFITKDHGEHHLAQRPRDVPMRTAVGIAGLTFLGVIFVAGSNDVIASNTATGLQQITWILRVAVFVLPVLTGMTAHRVASTLLAREQEPAPTAEGTDRVEPA
jgi:ubiquinol-cytochrome c reductase cytochrome b subunit